MATNAPFIREKVGSGWQGRLWWKVSPERVLCSKGRICIDWGTRYLKHLFDIGAGSIQGIVRGFIFNNFKVFYVFIVVIIIFFVFETQISKTENYFSIIVISFPPNLISYQISLHLFWIGGEFKMLLVSKGLQVSAHNLYSCSDSVDSKSCSCLAFCFSDSFLFLISKWTCFIFIVSVYLLPTGSFTDHLASQVIYIIGMS